MPITSHLLQRLRGAPEPLKQHLRPLLVRGVDVVYRIPGGGFAASAVRRLTPGLHGWLRRRYLYYRDSSYQDHTSGTAADAARRDASDAAFDNQIVLGWLRRSGCERVN